MKWLWLLAADAVEVDADGKFTFPGFYNPSGGANDLFKVVGNTLIYLIGAISVIMIIVGGFKFVVSQGNAAGTKAARETILYAIVGLVISILAFAAVNFVVDKF